MRSTTRSTTARARSTIALAVGLTLGALAGCSGSDSAAPSTGSGPTTAGSITVGSTDAARTEVPSSTDTPAAADAPAATDTRGSTILLVPDTGVPGIDSDDPFCNAWSRFAGSFQALVFASNFAGPDEAVRLEVAASDAVVLAVADLERSFPSTLDVEREAFLNGLLGPFAARASAARASMLDAGLTSEQVARIGDAWLEALSDSGLGDPDLEVVVPVGAEEAFASAVIAFGVSAPVLATDPSLVTDATAPLTESYIAETCPDQGILGGNDIIVD